MNLIRGIDLKKIAGKMNGASGAELKVLFSLRPVCLMKSNFFENEFRKNKFWKSKLFSDI
jgi:26S proteasome regulatory subunit T6